MKTRIPFIGAAYAFEDAAVALQETINYYLEVGGEDQREPLALIGVPGMVAFSTTHGPTRAVGLFFTGSEAALGSGDLYACTGASFGIVGSNGSFTKLGTLTGGSGRLWMREMRSYIAIADAPFDVINGFAVFPSSVSKLYTYHKESGLFSTITNEVFTEFGGHNPDTFFISNIDDPNSYNALNFTAVNTRYNIVTAVQISQQRVVIFGSEYIEFYYFSGGATFPLERQEGATIELGCRHPGSIVNIDGMIYFLATNNKVYRINGYTPEVISTRPVEENILSHGVASSIDAFAYTWKGHKFYNLTIISANSDARTWVYDETLPPKMGWTRRKTYGVDYWRGYQATEAYGNVFVGDINASRIWRLDSSVYTEGSDPLECVRTGYYIHSDQKTFKISDFELVFKEGAESVDEDPGVFMSYSKDGGNTFSAEIERKFSDTRLIWRNNGIAHGSCAFKVRIADRRNRDLVSATCRLVPGNDR